MIPCFMQLHPEIGVEQEDTNIFMAESDKKGSQWFWLMMGRLVYLVTPREEADDPMSRKLFYHKNAAMLLKFYRQSTNYKG